VPKTETVAGSQKARVAQHQARGQKSIAQELLRPVEIPKNFVEQSRALGQPRFQFREFIRTQQRGNGVQVPGAVARLDVTGDVVGDAMIANELANLFRAQAKTGGPQAIEKSRQWANAGS
jgi:hypothetical protein